MSTSSVQDDQQDDGRHVVLVVEEDPATSMFIADNLTADGYEAVTSPDWLQAVNACRKHRPDLAIVDVNGGTGRQFSRAVRGGTAEVDRRLPIILLGGGDSELDVLRAFESGADDHVRKPFSYPELRARAAALLRRVELESASRKASPVRQFADVMIDRETRRVEVGGLRVDQLSKKEFALLWILAGDPERVFSKDELLREVWGHESKTSTRTLDSHICRIRNKLGILGDHYLDNVWGYGYAATSETAVAA